MYIFYQPLAGGITVQLENNTLFISRHVLCSKNKTNLSFLLKIRKKRFLFTQFLYDKKQRICNTSLQ